MTTFFLEYNNIFVFILCLFVFILFILSFTSTYKYGIPSFSETSYPFEVQFAVIAIFLFFDIEVLYLFPLVSSLYSLVILDVFKILGFYVLLLLIGLLYEISRKVLDFHIHFNKSLFLGLLNKIIKVIFIVILFIFMLPIMVVEGAAASETNNTTLLQELVNSFTEEEVDRFNEMNTEQGLYDRFIHVFRRILLAVAINASIYFIFRYGVDIINSTIDLFRSLPETVANVTSSLFTTAREVALHAVEHATPEQRERLLANARQIILARGQGGNAA